MSITIEQGVKLRLDLPVVGYLTLVPLPQGAWVMKDAIGRFDTSKALDAISGLHWVVGGDRFRPFSLFTYYQPQHIVRTGFDLSDISRLAIVGVASLVLAIAVFSRRDL